MHKINRLPLLSLVLHQYGLKTRAKDQDVFEQIAIVFMHYRNINLITCFCGGH